MMPLTRPRPTGRRAGIFSSRPPADSPRPAVWPPSLLHIQGPQGGRRIPINEFYVPYGDDPARENVLRHGELITAVELPATPFFARSHYLKVRDRSAFEFALASAAVALEIKDGKITAARVTLGGVATMPWRSADAEKALVGAAPGCRKDEPARGESFADILRRQGREAVEVTHRSKPGDETKKYSMHAFGAQFVEVRVDPDLGTVRVARVVSGFAAGRIINPKTAHSQAIGGIVGGLGMALLEETVHDRRNGRVVNANFADYLVPVNLDVPPLEAFFVEEEDRHVNPLGAKGLAELSLVGVAPAVANAVYHATSKRVRDLPITPDKLL